MSRGTNTKVWVIILMTVMVLAMFGGIPGIAQEPDFITGVKPTPIVLSPPTEPTTRSVLLTEDFSASWVPCGTGYDAPPGWTVEGISSTQYWRHYDDANTGFPTSNSTPLAAGLWWHTLSQDEWLITPQLDFSNYVDCTVTFNAVYTMPSFGAGPTAHEYIKVSTNEGSTWDTLGDLCHDPQFEIPGATGGPGGAGWCWYEGFIMNPGAPSPLCIDLGAYDHESSVLIAWNYQCVDNDKSGLHCIDDVHVDGDYSPLVDHIEVEPDPLMIVVGDTQQFTATAYDASNNTIPGAIILWSTDVGIVNSNGSFTAQTTPGIGIVTATSGAASDSADVTVICGAIDHIIVIPDPVSVPVGATQAFMAEAHDVFCNVIPGVEFIWTTNIGLIDASGFFTAQSAPGVGIVTAENGTVSGFATVTVIEAFTIDISSINANGWLLMSYPTQISGHPFTVIVDALDNGGGFVQWDIIRGWDEYNKTWLTSAKFWPPSLNTFNYVDNTMGFWLHISDLGDNNFTFAGPLATSGEMAVIPLIAGWNLIGYPFHIGQPAMGTLGSLFSLQGSVYTYDPSAQYGYRIFNIMSENQEPGQAYWVCVAFDDNLVMWCP